MIFTRILHRLWRRTYRSNAAFSQSRKNAPIINSAGFMSFLFLGMSIARECPTTSDCQDNVTQNSSLSHPKKEKDTKRREPLDALRPSIARFDRIDEKLLESEFKVWVKDNAFHDTLRGENLIEIYEVYEKKRDSFAQSSNTNEEESVHEVWAIVKFGKSLNGHPGIVHGGLISTAFDNTYGWLFFSMKTRAAFTANLNVNFRRPLYAKDAIVVIKTKLVKMEGRKLFMSAIMEDFKGELIADSTSLFITAPTVQDVSLKWLRTKLKSFGVSI